MKVLMLLYNPFEHDARVLKEARTLAEAGHDVTVFALRASALPQTEARDGIKVQRIDNDPIPARLRSALTRRASRRARSGDASTGRPQAQIATPSFLWRLAHYAYQTLAYARFAAAVVLRSRRELSEVYIAHDLEMLPIAELVRRLNGGRVIYDSHELFVERQYSFPPRSRFWKIRWSAIERLLIRRADQVVTVCQPIAEELARRYRVTAPTVVMNVPYARAAIHQDQPNPRLRERLGLLRTDRLVLYLGGIQPDRGLEQTIEALTMLPGYVLAAMGPGSEDYSETLLSGARSFGVGDRVHLLTPVHSDAVVSHAVDADVGMSTIRNAGVSYYHSLPNKLFEYMAAGVPVVGSNFPTMGSLIRENSIGVVCDPDDPNAIASAIRSVTEDAGRHEKLRENGLRAARRFTWEQESRKLVELVATRPQ